MASGTGPLPACLSGAVISALAVAVGGDGENQRVRNRAALAVQYRCACLRRQQRRGLGQLVAQFGEDALVVPALTASSSSTATMEMPPRDVDSMVLTSGTSRSACSSGLVTNASTRAAVAPG
jgi:hypothetical protein